MTTALKLLSLGMGMLPLLLEGALLLRLVEGRTALLRRTERLAYGFLISVPLSGFLVFLLGWANMPLTLLSLSLLHFVVLAGLVAATSLLVCTDAPSSTSDFPTQPSSILNAQCSIPRLPSSPHFSRELHILLLLLLLWLGARIAILGFITLSVPTYQDDAFNNWNYRGKVFHALQSLHLADPTDPLFFGGGQLNYPPAVSLLRTWFALVHGSWDDGVVNATAILWFLALLGSVYHLAQRLTESRSMGLLAAYLLGSMPLILIHGTNPFVDLLLAGLLLLAMALWSLHRLSGDRRWIRVLGLSLAALAFTKNEAILLYLPPLLLFIALDALGRRGWKLDRSRIKGVAWVLLPLVAVLLPWLGFRELYGLGASHGGGHLTSAAFSLTDTKQARIVIFGLYYTVFMEANWHLLIPLFLFVVALSWRSLHRSPVFVPLLSIVFSYLLTSSLYFVTDLGKQVVSQTGINRGMLHLIPSIALLTLTLLAPILERAGVLRKGSGIDEGSPTSAPEGSSPI